MPSSLSDSVTISMALAEEIMEVLDMAQYNLPSEMERAFASAAYDQLDAILGEHTKMEED